MRIAEKNRDTKETKIYEKINLDGNGNSDIDATCGNAEITRRTENRNR